MTVTSFERGSLPRDDRRADALAPRIAEMRRMLDAMKPASVSDRLKALRQRFPDAPLHERMRALSSPQG